MTPRFSIMQYLFSFQGRINRAKYWAFFGLSILVNLLFVAISSILAAAFANAGDPDSAQTASVVVALIQIMLFVPYLVAWLAISVKRWHDRNKSGWWVLMTLVPVIGPIWTLVECGCMKGTEGENRHGPDPLAPAVETVFE